MIPIAKGYQNRPLEFIYPIIENYHMNYSLTMTFINTSGDKVNLSISGVKPDITESQVAALMDTIIAKDVFLSNGGALASKYGAQLTQRQSTKFDLR